MGASVTEVGPVDDAADEVAFADGNVTGATRVGDTVRCSTGPGTPAVHALLRHLERVGFDSTPRVLGFDSRGREVLTYIEGETSPDPRVSFGSDEALAAVAQLLHSYHDSVAAFEPPPDAAWRYLIGAPRGHLVCHNDIAPYNTIVSKGRPAAFIDWDFAAPAPREWDIAHALWRFVPLYHDEEFGTPAERSHRIEVFCDAYEVEDRRGLIDTILQRQQATHDSVVAWEAEGHPAFVRLLQEGHADGTLHDIAYVRAHRSDLERRVRVSPG